MSLYAPSRDDIVIQDPDRQFVAVVEIKNMQNLTRDIATAVRGNSMIYSLLPQTPYFLLLSQDKGFIWKEAWREGPETPPSYEFPMDAVVTRYLHRKPDDRLYNEELRYLVLQWLTDLADGKPQMSEEPEKTLALAGFDASIKEAYVSIRVEEE